jgi:predicted ester cyclase
MTQPATGDHENGNATHLTQIREYYACFNDRRFADAASMFTDDAVLEQMPFQRPDHGGTAYRRFAELWTQAFPDMRVTIDEVTERHPGAVEVQLAARGTHTCDLTIGGCVFRPTGVSTDLRLRELLEFRGDRLSASVVSFDLQELAHQLARVDDTQLLMHLSRLRYMEEQLRGAALTSQHRLTLLDSIGHELDAARRIVRPYFTR